MTRREFHPSCPFNLQPTLDDAPPVTGSVSSEHSASHKMTANAGKCYVRLVQARDYSRIEEIYLEHEGKALPVGYFDEFREAIRSDEIIYLVAEVDGRVIGGGGIADYVPRSHASLIFGVVALEHTRKGYGTALMAARLVLVDPGLEGCEIGVVATEWSLGFFTRLGFHWHSKEKDQLGHQLHHGTHMVYLSGKRIFRRILDAGGVTLERELEHEFSAESVHGGNG